MNSFRRRCLAHRLSQLLRALLVARDRSAAKKTLTLGVLPLLFEAGKRILFHRRSQLKHVGGVSSDFGAMPGMGPRICDHFA